MKTIKPSQTEKQIQNFAIPLLSKLVSIDSASDRDSKSIPSTIGQISIAHEIVAIYSKMHISAFVEMGNVIAFIPSKNPNPNIKPIVFFTHIDTVKGTQPLDTLSIIHAWDGKQNIPYTNNKKYECNVSNFTDLKDFVGHDVIFGNGLNPFGLDDKLGLAESLTLAWLITQNQNRPDFNYPPIYFVHRPDEEINSQKTLGVVLAFLKKHHVEYGYTIDGMLPFEINDKSFNSVGVNLSLPTQISQIPIVMGYQLTLQIQGICSHTFRSAQERFTPALLFVCDILAQAKHLQFSILDFQSKGGKGMDGVLRILFENEQDTQAFVNIAQKTILSKTKYGADITSIHIQRLSNQTIVIDQSIPKMLRYVMNATSKFRLPRDSQNLQGFVNLVKITKEKNKNVLFVQVTDFDYQQMLRQVMMLVEMGLADQMSVDIRAIYNNIEKHIQKHKYLINIPTQSALGLGFKPNLVPMRYSNGADLFLKQGLMIGNLGTGYFGAESPKEITSVQMLIRHSLWLFDICQRFYQF